MIQRRLTIIAITIAVPGAIGCARQAPGVVRIGGDTIVRAAADRWAAVINGGRTTTPSPAAKKRGLEFLIISSWILQAAQAMGQRVSGREVTAAIAAEQRAAFPGGYAELDAFLAQTGRTRADLELEAKTRLGSAKLRHAVMLEAPVVTGPEVVAYYARHKAAFVVPEQRQVEVTNRKTPAAVEQIKREVRAGLKFGSISQVAELTPDEHASSGYKPDVEARVPIERAIFAAKPRVLTGPIKGRLDYYLFEVTKIKPAVQRSLDEVRSLIHQRLTEEHQRAEMQRFVTRWSRAWKARTDCWPGYVVPLCRQYAGTPEVTSLNDGYAPG